MAIVSHMLRGWLNTITRWFNEQVDALRIVGRCLLPPAGGKAFWSRMAAFTGSMCNGGILITGWKGSPSPAGADEPVAVGISTFIQFDGDIVIRLDRRYRQLSPPQQTAALDNHIRAVNRAIRPMQELQALVTATTTLLRILAVAVLGRLEILPIAARATESIAAIPGALLDAGLFTHLASLAMLILAVLAPRLLRGLIHTVAQSKLNDLTGQAWDNDKQTWLDRVSP